MKGPMPPIELDDFQPEEIKQLTREELDKLPFEVVHWRCKVKLCKGYTRMRDYGLGFEYYHPRFGWINQIHNYFLCGAHNKAFKNRWNSDPEKVPLRPYWGGDDTVKPNIIY
jgi:hypothetical protein